jgi:hypothetical protein
MSNNVFLLWHVHEFEDQDDDEKLLGVFSSEDKAKESIVFYSSQPGFIEHPDGFIIVKYAIDELEWKEGFHTINH